MAEGLEFAGTTAYRAHKTIFRSASNHGVGVLSIDNVLLTCNVARRLMSLTVTHRPHRLSALTHSQSCRQLGKSRRDCQLPITYSVRHSGTTTSMAN